MREFDDALQWSSRMGGKPQTWTLSAFDPHPLDLFSRWRGPRNGKVRARIRRRALPCECAASMQVGVVSIGDVRMLVLDGVRMPMAVRSGWHRVVRVIMMPVVVTVPVFVLQPHAHARAGATRPGAATPPRASTARPEPSPRFLSDRPRIASPAPMKGAKANTDPVRAAPNARCARR